MIKINNKQYDDYKIEITWGNFSVSNGNGEKRFGKAPFITFYLENNIKIGLEFTFSQVMFLNTPTNIKTNIKEYLSDITFENNEGWDTLTSGKYDCNITKINEKVFNLDFYVEESKIKIFINADIDLF